MKKMVACFLVMGLLVGFCGVGIAETVNCSDATFRCYNSNGALLGDISVTCSIQLPFNSLTPRCMPNFPLSAFASIDACKTKYPTAHQACPNQAWPSGYAWSQCIHYPTF